MKESYKQVLWAINDKCPYGCKYCYLSFDDKHNPIVKDKKQEADNIINLLSDDSIKTVFLAGAEPLLNPNLIHIIKKLKYSNKKVVLCTNALILNNDLWNSILSTKLDAISISLDSFDKNYNDHVRNAGGWENVVKNIQHIKSYLKANNLSTKIGIYSVVTKENLKDLYKTYEFCSLNLKVDYYIYQPITLPPQHKMYKDLMLNEDDHEEFKLQIQLIRNSNLPTYNPNEKYIELMFEGLNKITKDKCFINNDFIFVMPDGIYSQCPCFKAKREIRNINNTKDLSFNRLLNCSCFSEECSNIYQLINFEEIFNE